ncbi:MAG: membrane protein insertion efficiency factor YidD [Phycisphaerae bacterium]
MSIANPLLKINKAISRFLILTVQGYQRTLGRVLGGRCRYFPTCSEYFIGAVEKYGPWRGTLKGLWRILRCNPFAKGGFDLY